MMISLAFTILLLILGFMAFTLLAVRMHRFDGGSRLLVCLFVLSLLVAVLVSAGWLPRGCGSRRNVTVQTDRE